MIGKRVLTIFAAALVCLAIVGGVVLAAAALPPVPGQQENGASTGYRLTNQSWQAYGVLSGPGYRLQGAINGTGTPCYCVYLPCSLRNSP